MSEEGQPPNIKVDWNSWHVFRSKADSLQPPGAGPGDAYLNGFAGGGVFGFGLAGNVLSVP